MANKGLAKAHNKENYTDEWYTPDYAVKPILKYLSKPSNIWCPFDTKESEYVKQLEADGHQVIYSHIENEEDFFTTNPPTGCQYIISNPPYSLRNRILKRLYELKIPFAMLMPLATLETPERAAMFRDNGMELLSIDIRIAFIPSNETEMRLYYNTKGKAIMENKPFKWNGVKGASMNTSYFCWNILPEKLIFAKVVKHAKKRT